MGREARWLLGLIIVLLFAGWLLYSIPSWVEAPGGGSFVESYEARLSGNTLTENYTYWVTGSGHHYLYRYWRAPLYLAGHAPGGPHLELVDVECPSGSVAYLRDSNGTLYVKGDAGEPGPVDAMRGEAGCYFPKGIKEGGPYKASFTFKLYMPVRCGGGSCFAVLNLADNHIRYDRIRVTVEGAERAALLAEDVKTSSGGGRWVMEGWSPEDTAVKLYLLYKSPPPGAVVEKTGDAAAEYGDALFWEPGLRGALKASAPILVLVPAAVLLAAYLKWGVERENPVVPEYTYYVPNEELKPWQVNVVFAGRPGTVTGDGVAATILDLARRGIVKPWTTGDLLFELPENPPWGLDRFEKLVFALLKVFEGPPGFWSPRNSKLLVGERKSDAVSIMRKILRSGRDIVRDYIDAPPGWFSGSGLAVLIGASMVGFALWSPVYAPWHYVPVLAVAGVGVGMIATGVAPSDVMGRWKPGKRWEAEEWWSFARMLRDLARLDVALPQDVAVWKEWLAYGTALGVGEKVVEAMRMKGIHIPEVDAYEDLVMTTGLVYSATVSSESGGAGGAGGGGFGGGGAGVR